VNNTTNSERTAVSSMGTNIHAEGPATSEAAERFSLVFQGPLYRLLLRFGNTQERLSNAVRRSIFAVAICWLPLLVLSLMQGESYNRQIRIPFLFDLANSIRFLIALPILVLAEISIDRRLRRVVRQFLDARLVTGAELPSFEAVIKRIERLHNRLLPEIVMLMIAFAPSLRPNLADFYIGGVATWHIAGTGGNLSYAGWWFLLVSVPLYRFLMLRWVWRLALWATFLRNVMRVKLHLVPGHPDLAAGLGFLTEAQKAFSLIVFAGGAVISGSIGNAVLYEGATIRSTQPLMITYVVAASLAMVAPLLFVTPVLTRTRTRALFEFGAMNAAHDQAFDARWVGPGAANGNGLLGHPDANSLANLSHGFENVHDIRPIPLDKRTLVALVIAAALPIAPVILIATPVNVLIGDVVKLLR
jgi:hypothetical protein